MAEPDEVIRELDACCEAGIHSLLSVLHVLESISEPDLTVEMRQWREEQRLALREDLMKITGDADGRRLRVRIDQFVREHRTYPKAG